MRFPTQVPTLRDGEVLLRAPGPGDVQGVVEQCVDPLSRRWTTVPLNYTAEDAKVFLSTVIPGAWQAGDGWSFVVEAPDEAGNARFCGTVSLRNKDEGRLEVAYGAHPWARGRGVMERALRLLLRWGFDELGAETIIWWANKGNWASRKVAWRLGFTFEGAPRAWLPQRGTLTDSWVGTLVSGDPLEPRTTWLDVPVIRGRAVLLRRHRESDYDRVVEACQDAETARWLGQIPQPFTRADAVDFLESKEDEHAAGTAVTWAMADPATDELIGLINLFAIRPGRQAEVGYWVHPAARGRGVASEATRLAVRHAFVPVEDGGLGLRRVRALAAEENLASRTVLERAGLTVQGRERLATTLSGGELADAVLYDIVASETGPA